MLREAIGETEAALRNRNYNGTEEVPESRQEVLKWYRYREGFRGAVAPGLDLPSMNCKFDVLRALAGLSPTPRRGLSLPRKSNFVRSPGPLQLRGLGCKLMSGTLSAYTLGVKASCSFCLAHFLRSTSLIFCPWKTPFFLDYYFCNS